LRRRKYSHIAELADEKAKLKEKLDYVLDRQKLCHQMLENCRLPLIVILAHAA
jgi:hypothetical protein